MKTPAKVFREYDIRGEADRDLSDELVHAIGRALATVYGAAATDRRPQVAVGRDCRASSDRLFAALTDGLMAAGADVIDIGIGPTPLLYFAAHHLATDGAVMITGSHNPPQDNGFKMMQGKGTLFGEAIQSLRGTIGSEAFRSAAAGTLERRDITEDYVAGLVSSVRGDLLGQFGDQPVVVDAGNGAAGPLALRSLKALGVRVVPLHCEMDGRFPNHHPDPTVEKNLEDLRRKVAEVGAPLGVAYDGDGDRIGVIDGGGEVIWGDKLMVLYARQVLADHPGAAIIGEVKCSETLYADIRDKGGRAIVNKTGHSLIKKRMKDEGAMLAGEMSGHIFFADRYFGFDDAIYATARLLEIVGQSGSSPSALLADLPATFVTPELRRDCPDEVKFAVVDAVRTHFQRSHDVLAVDGARIDFGDGAWGLCRASNTGPVLVLRFEAKSAARRDAIQAEVEAQVAAALASVTSPAGAPPAPADPSGAAS